MSADGAASNRDAVPDHAIHPRESPPALALGGASPHRAEADVLRKSLSAVMVEYHEQSKRNLQLSRDVAALAGERDALRLQRGELEKRLFDIESSISWVATGWLREVSRRHPRLRRLATAIRRILARS